ncbi:MAG TPA: peptidoglycan DD-metalloendopeptidase family protein [Bacteroidia bacterium]|nr:peptidoglycan DD-metalloendopeptidase family protein [Bacteroidia bacterium]
MIHELLRTLSSTASELFDFPMKGHFPPRIDLSLQNIRNTGDRPYEFEQLNAFVQARLLATGSPVVWGGYLEQRLIYNSSPLFHQDRHARTMHLGLDFWTQADSAVHAPIAGTVHSFQDNAAFRDYGPTIILRHETPGLVFHSLYGHLSRASLEGLAPGMPVAQGQRIGWLGRADENGQWPPHLHFQLMRDLQGHSGDYPGVCALENLKQFKANCPDPRLLLGI